MNILRRCLLITAFVAALAPYPAAADIKVTGVMQLTGLGPNKPLKTMKKDEHALMDEMAEANPTVALSLGRSVTFTAYASRQFERFDSGETSTVCDSVLQQDTIIHRHERFYALTSSGGDERRPTAAQGAAVTLFDPHETQVIAGHLARHYLLRSVAKDGKRNPDFSVWIAQDIPSLKSLKRSGQFSVLTSVQQSLIDKLDGLCLGFDLPQKSKSGWLHLIYRVQSVSTAPLPPWTFIVPRGFQSMDGAAKAPDPAVVERDDKDLNSKLLKEAYYGGDSRILELLKAGANVDYQGIGNVSPLVAAATFGLKNTVQLLLDHGAKINVSDNQKNTPLMIAAQNGDTEIVKVLLEHGADTTAKKDNGSTAFNLAARNHYSEIAALLTVGAKK